MKQWIIILCIVFLLCGCQTGSHAQNSQQSYVQQETAESHDTEKENEQTIIDNCNLDDMNEKDEQEIQTYHLDLPQYIQETE